MNKLPQAEDHGILSTRLDSCFIYRLKSVDFASKFNKFFSINIAVLLFWLCVSPVKAESIPSLSFSPDSISLKKDSNSSVDIYLNPGKEEIVGVDLVMSFDPNNIELTNISDYGLLTYKAKEIIDNNSGKLKVAFSNDFGKYFSGTSARLTTIYFKSKSQNSKSSFSFSFEKGKTNDTNIVNKAGIDVLESVNSLSITNSNSSAVASSEKPKPTKAVDKILASNQEERTLKSNEEKFVFPSNISENNPEVLGEGTTEIPVLQKHTNYLFYILIAVVMFLISVFAF
ncbi:MAG: hypothetical protein ACD_12C00659G0001, partial [uncultured bacterium]